MPTTAGDGDGTAERSSVPIHIWQSRFALAHIPCRHTLPLAAKGISAYLRLNPTDDDLQLNLGSAAGIPS